ncbi:MAG: 3-dehydroquinate synthase [Alphaproteobacteria bacterium]|nr:3-dehydroquinate synthase [Alphaproteobacteria bacterium]
MSDAQRLRVELGARSYDIVVGSHLLAQAGALMAGVVRHKRALVVTDANVARLHLDMLRRGLDAAGFAHEAIAVPPGEETKDFAHFQKLCEDILATGIERATPLIALGGGVVGDLAGFAAATLLRGLDYVQIPTTLLAQVDSSVGGKTAIDTRQGKNLVGAFHQPTLVIADIDTLATLPRRELLAGYAEVVKYGLIRDRAFYEWLEVKAGALLRGDADLRREAVLRSCAGKAAVVAADEREAGERALLNFGHTFGHALEAATGFGEALLHGEAVALGMRMAFDLSAKLRLCPAESANRVCRHFASIGLRIELDGMDADRLLELMRKDKKVKDGRISLILVRNIGQAFVSRDVAPELLREFLVQEIKTLAPRARAL